MLAAKPAVSAGNRRAGRAAPDSDHRHSLGGCGVFCWLLGGVIGCLGSLTVGVMAVSRRAAWPALV